MGRQYRVTLIAALLVACAAGAQGGKRGATRGGKGKKDGSILAEGATVVFVRTQVNTMDTDGNMTIEEGELEQGFLKVLDAHEQRYSKLLALFDEDKDGALNEAESQAARKCLLGLAGMLRYDRNRDWKVDEAESEQAWEGVSGACERQNEGTLKRFDKNKDGKLDDDETESAKATLREWKQKREGN